jgi:hypothetical protein
MNKIITGIVVLIVVMVAYFLFFNKDTHEIVYGIRIFEDPGSPTGVGSTTGVDGVLGVVGVDGVLGVVGAATIIAVASESLVIVPIELVAVTSTLM